LGVRFPYGQEDVVLWHVVKFRMKPEVGPAERAGLHESLRGLVDSVPSLRFLRVADSIDEPDVVGLITGFEDVAGLDEYKVHEAHVPVVELARELSAEIVRLDIATPDSSDALPLSASGT
jgi:hypothetical protein